MLSYSLSTELLAQLQDLQKKIALVYADISHYDADLLDAIHRDALIGMIGASTRIENAQLTDQEIEWIDTILTMDGKHTAFIENKQIIEDKLSKDRERSIEEVAGCRAMLMLIYQQAKDFTPLTATIIRGLHTTLMEYYEGAKHYRGKYKKNSNSVIETNQKTGESRTVFQTADPGPMTDVAMDDLINWYNETKKQATWSIALSCELVYRFLAIHPFQDGNGRLGRGLFALSLLQSNDEPLSVVAKYLAIDRQIEKTKQEYYFVLNRCSQGVYQQDAHQYNIEIFLRYMLKIIKNSLDDITLYKSKWEAKKRFSESAVIVLACFKDRPEIRLTTRMLMEITQLPRRTITNSLSKLVKHNFIQRYGQGRSVRYQLVF
ncbi:MAG: Fic family protein [Coxiellaceae bacterium]|nr:Fic family protein [Coxiellaceae bacterium]